jgi:hypothetical protein
MQIAVTLPEPHAKQREFIKSKAKRKMIKAGRRSGKTVGIGIYAVESFLAGHRVLYAAPTSEQIDRFWTTVTRALEEPIRKKVLRKNETEHIIEITGTERRIRAKTAWNANTLRGDYADVLILDEFQLMNEDTWSVVGAPMMLDTDGTTVFIYTPPSLHSRSVTKARDPRHASKLYKKAQANATGRWETFGFTSHDNPHLSKEALAEISEDMTATSYRMEIMAEDIEEAPGALWTRKGIDESRVHKPFKKLDLIVVGVDPSATSTGDEAGIITGGAIWHTPNDYYTLADDSVQGSPKVWATAAVTAYYKYNANYIVAESNNGGEMVSTVIHQIDPSVPVKMVHASRSKHTRAEPVSAVHEKGRDHHVGTFPMLEDEECLWVPGDPSPNRMDAKVWMMTALMGKLRGKTAKSWSG